MPKGDAARTDKPAKATELYADGKVKFTGFHLEGEMHGSWSWYRTDGSLMRTGHFERGTQTGTWRTYDRSGTVVKETTFKDASS
jgi:antitoxin component YwqK of YwqJK toxin-antitoxin module